MVLSNNSKTIATFDKQLKMKNASFLRQNQGLMLVSSSTERTVGQFSELAGNY